MKRRRPQRFDMVEALPAQPDDETMVSNILGKLIRFSLSASGRDDGGYYDQRKTREKAAARAKVLVRLRNEFEHAMADVELAS